ncbi:MAG TPA: class III extradiol ring-cleavage dioxygenase [Burkholderiaceae bacterium]|nr:class III extradiol ring-cleavage dioxygenase [Burkholderiaceae bacterium]
MTSRLPSLFVSHGAPTLALQPGRAGAALAAFAHTMPTPRAVLVVSPHWSTSTLQVTARDRQEAWHDFRGFPRALYALRYDAPGDPALAQRVRDMLANAGIACELDATRALDHGAWVPLRLMYPQANIPVVQLSLLSSEDARVQWKIGAALSALRDEGVLVLTSGSFTHNLHEFDPLVAHDAPPDPYVEEFRAWMIKALIAGDRTALLDWRTRAPHAMRAHPTDEHLLPLFIALSAAGERFTPVMRLTDEVTYGMLAMDAFAFNA